MIQTSPKPQFSLPEASVTANRTTDLDGSADRNITQAEPVGSRGDGARHSGW